MATMVPWWRSPISAYCLFLPEILCLRRGGQYDGNRRPAGERCAIRCATLYPENDALSHCFLYIKLSSSAKAEDLRQEEAPPEISAAFGPGVALG